MPQTVRHLERLMARYVLLLLICIPIGCAYPVSRDNAGHDPPIFSFGVVADAQYADKETAGLRHYRASLRSLDAAVDTFNRSDLRFVVHLGDLIDEQFSSYDAILPVLHRADAPHYIVLGNHEFSVEESRKREVLPRLGLRQRYYDFVVDGWRFIALDGQGLSTFAPADGARAEANATLEQLQQQGSANAYEWNGGIDQPQFLWLQERLDLASQNGESVVVFCHFPAFPAGMTHNLWNDNAVVHLLLSYPVVRAWFNGHNHAGYTGIADGIHFVTFKGMVEHPEENAFAIAHVYPDRIVIEGFGAEDTRVIPIRGVYVAGGLSR